MKKTQQSIMGVNLIYHDPVQCEQNLSNKQRLDTSPASDSGTDYELGGQRWTKRTNRGN